MLVSALLAVLLAVFQATLPQEGETWYTVTGASGLRGGHLSTVEQAVEKGLEKLEPFFPGAPHRSFLVIVHDTAETLTDDVTQWLHRGAPGLALLRSQEVHLILGEMDPGGPTNLQGVVEHELAHILLHQFSEPGAQSIPLWFHEGLAQELSGARYLGGREEDLVFGARFDNLPSLATLRSVFPREDFALRQAYAQSFSFVAYLGRQLGHELLLEIARDCGEDLDFGRAFVERTRRSIVSFEATWLEYLENESGAAFRVVMRNCFSYLMILVVPVLALAVIKRLARDRRAHEKLRAAEEAEEQEW